MTDFLDPGQDMMMILLTALPLEDTARGVIVAEEEQESDLDTSTSSQDQLSVLFITAFYIECTTGTSNFIELFIC